MVHHRASFSNRITVVHGRWRAAVTSQTTDSCKSKCLRSRSIGARGSKEVAMLVLSHYERPVAFVVMPETTRQSCCHASECALCCPSGIGPTKARGMCLLWPVTRRGQGACRPSAGRAPTDDRPTKAGEDTSSTNCRTTFVAASDIAESMSICVRFTADKAAFVLRASGDSN